MEKISIFIVLILSLFVSDATCRVCSYNQYYKKATGCVQCRPCPAGTEATKNCGYNEAGERTPGALRCKKCPKNEFKAQESTDMCATCQSCMNGKLKIQECNLTSNTVCKCPQGTQEYYGNCRPVPVTTPLTTPKITTTAHPVRTPLTTPKITTTAHPVTTPLTTPNITTTAQISTQMDGLRSKLEPVLQVHGLPDRPFPQPGWIVLFCLLGFLFIVAFIFVSVHKRTRKQISGFFCRKYRALWPDLESEAASNIVKVEDHYVEEQVTHQNYATPIPPWDEPVPTVVRLSSTSEQVYCSCATGDIGEEKMQCACTQTASDPTLYKMAHTSSSSETISEELQCYYQGRSESGLLPTRKSSPSHSTSSGVSSARSPDLYPLISPRVTPTPPRRLSPDHRCVTPSSSSSSPGMTPRGGSPEHHCVTASSSSTCEISAPLRGLSPEHCFVSSSSTSLPGVTPRQRSPDLCVKSSSSSTCVTPLRGRSPDLPRIQIRLADDSSNQSNECSEVPVSIEACDKKHDTPIAPTSINSTPPARQKRGKSQPSGKRKSLSPTNGPLCACQQEQYPKLRCKEPAVKEKDVHPVSTNKDTELPVGTDIKMDGKEDLKMKTNVAENDRLQCMYRPIKRNGEVQHRCPECSPMASDLFFQLINRERLCLKEEICKELDRSYKDLAILGRVESDMKEYETCSKPAERVLENLKALHPGMKLEEFEQILRRLERLDVVDVIYNHHLSCTLCRRNSFDSKA